MHTLDGLIAEILNAPTASATRTVLHVAQPRIDDSLPILSQLSIKLKKAEPSLCPIVLSPPRGAFDTGSVAMVQTSVGLMEHGLANGPLSAVLKERSSWGSKVSAVKDVLVKSSDQIVLLVNAPLTWASLRNNPEDPEFGEHAESAARLIDEIDCRKIVIEKRKKPSAKPLDIRCGAFAERLLEDDSKWGSLKAYARDVLKRYGAKLEELSEMELRLLVAFKSTHEPMPDDLDDPLGYILRLQAFIQRNPPASYLQNILETLSLLRGAFPDSILDHLQVNKLGQPWLDILKICILQGTEGGWVIPWSLHAGRRGAMSARLTDEENRSRHAAIANCYVELISSDKSSKEEFKSYLPDMEVFHHASRAADGKLAMSRSVFFSEQLDALGKSLSQAGFYEEAVGVFKNSIVWDREDDYAHHYLAFNLDVRGEDRKGADEHYRAAIDYAPGKAWWWSRWICFLITVGRTIEAERAWSDAVSALGLGSQYSIGQGTTYFHLHSWVIRLLLHRGQLEFATQVLDGIPAAVFAEDSLDTGILGRLKTHLISLFEARRNRTVLPVFIDPRNWWIKRPNMAVCEPSINGKIVEKWFPGRIENVDDDQIFIALGQPPVDKDPESDVLTWMVSRNDFGRFSGTSKYSLHAGRFIELVYYEGEPEPIIFVRPEEAHGLPPVRPDPSRYLRHRQKGS